MSRILEYGVTLVPWSVINTEQNQNLLQRYLYNVMSEKKTKTMYFVLFI